MAASGKVLNKIRAAMKLKQKHRVPELVRALGVDHCAGVRQKQRRACGRF